jgi:cation diffusion facilitator CzcD-associated flavoprotein CzcO
VVGNVTHVEWELHLTFNGTGEVIETTHDHLIVASGNNHIPHIVNWRGQEEWSKTEDHERKILHSVYYREPQSFTGKSVLVVGSGGSGRDVVLQVRHYAKKVSQLKDSSEPVN